MSEQLEIKIRVSRFSIVARCHFLKTPTMIEVFSYIVPFVGREGRRFDSLCGGKSRFSLSGSQFILLF